MGKKLSVDWSSRGNRGSYYGCWSGVAAMVMTALSLFWAVYTYYVPYHDLSTSQLPPTSIIQSSSTPSLRVSPTVVSRSPSSSTSAAQISPIAYFGIVILLVEPR